MKYTIKLGTYQEGTIPLGFQKENKVKEIKFDTSIWESEYGEGVLTLAIQRNGDAQPYPKALVDNTWTIEAVDVEKKGIGECQLEYRVDDKVKESAVYKFFVERSLDSTGDMPDPYISYFEQIIEVGAQAEADADRAEEAADSIKNLTAEAETLPAGSSASASYDSETGVMTFGIPQGEQGERGQDGVTPDIDIGTVETLETGVPAYANITGTVENPSLNLGLPKGNTGDTGATGAPAGFGAVTATIDGTTGTPSVDVTASGADTAKNFAFAFHNLKGEQGEQGEQGDPGVVQDVTVNGTSVVDQNGVAVITMSELVKTVNGNPIVLDDALGEVKNLDVELLPIQEGSGTPSPSNVRPITGHDYTVFTDTGVNQWGGLTMANNIHDAVGNESASWLGTDTYGDFVTIVASSPANNKMAFKTAFKPNTQYTLIVCGKKNNTNASFNMGIWYTDGTLSYVSAPSVTADTVTTFVIVSAANKTIDHVSTLWASGTAYLYYNECGLFEGVKTASDFLPYYGQSKTVTLPHTVYGAGVGVTSGSGKEKIIKVTGSDIVSISLAGTSDAGKKRALIMLQTQPKTEQPTVVGNIKCNVLPSQTANATYMKTEGISYAGSLSAVYAYKDDLQTIADWQAFIEDNGMEFTYELATPTDLSTTPTDLTLYNGDNVISSDGDMELTYVQDMAIVIRKIESQI